MTQRLIRSPRLPRRTFLRGLLGGSALSVGVPLLGPMLNDNGNALASGAPIPRRLGVYMWGNGCKLDRWTPKKSLSDGTADWELSPALELLAPVKPYVSVVSGLNVMTGNDRGHHGGWSAVLSGGPLVSQPHPRSVYSSTFSLPSIDQVMASVVGRKTPFASLEVGVSRGVVANEGTTLRYLSHRGPDNPCPPEYSPQLVFDRLFGAAGAPGTGGKGRSAIAAARADGHSVLDVVADDVRRLRQQVGSHDAARLDQHLDNVREIELRMVKDWPRRPWCKPPTRLPADPFETRDGREPHAEINLAMSKLIALALSCDLTRVFSVMYSGGSGGTTFWEVGQTRSHHDLTHDEPKDQPLVHAATRFTVGEFTRFLRVLKDTPEGTGNLLDACAILGSSDLPEGRDHSWNDFPVLIAGRAGGALRHPGLHYRKVGGNLSAAPLTVLRAAGIPIEAFGRRGGRVTESITEIES